MSWFLLTISGIFEVFGIMALKEIVLKSKKRYYFALAFFFSLSLACISYALDEIAISVAYAVWTGIGTVGGVLVGVYIYGESKSFFKFFCLLLILLAAIGLKLSS